MSSGSAPKPRLKVFLVEDQEDTRFVLAYLLRNAGYEVREARTVKAALQEFAPSGSEVLVSDVGLPDGSGCELIRQLRQAGAAPYAIAMSGFGRSSDVAASLAAGFRHHLVKPIELEKLEQLLEEASVELGGAG